MKTENETVAPTTTSNLKRDDIYENILSWKYVLKWSYPKSIRISEREIIIQARKVLERHDYDPDPSGTALTVKISNSLPDVLNGYDIYERNKKLGSFLGIGTKENRVLRFTMLEYLEPIHSLPDLGQFKESVRHIALAIHYLASSKEGIKHRDINVNNLMFRRLGDDQIQGVLCDWDQASTYETEKFKDHTGTRNGTRAFLSIDMHNNPPPVHLERFDYESLFYVMYWISMNFSEGKFLPEKEKNGDVPDAWKFWNVRKDDLISAMKIQLLHSSKPLYDSPQLFTPFFLPLVDDWLEPLRNLFRDGYYFRNLYRGSARSSRRRNTSIAWPGPSNFDDATLGRNVCLQNIWTILQD